MKEIWVISERSDLDRGGEWSFENYDSGCRAFSNFEAAKKAFRNRIKEIVETEETMFTNGTITKLAKQFEEDYDIFPEESKEFISERLPEFFTNPDYEIPTSDIPHINDECCYALEITEEHLLIRSCDIESVCNGIDPYIFINCFHMDNPDKNYSLHIEDLFEYDDYTSHLFLDLRKVEIED